MTNIIILGGGFGGIRTALDLDKKLGCRKNVRITLIDRKEYQTFHSSLYEVASVFGVDHQHPFHTELKGAICLPLKEMFFGTHINFIQAEVVQVDLKLSFLITGGGNKLNFDYLVIAIGSVASTFNIPGVAEYAYKFKTIEDGLFLADELESFFTKPNKLLPLRIIIGGAGFTGVELAAELSFCIKHLTERHELNLKPATVIQLLEAGPVILPTINEEERGLIKNRLKKIGVEIFEKAGITEIKSNCVKIADGRVMPADFVIWTSGVKSPELIENISDLELNKSKRIIVNNFLQIKNYNNVFGVGDNVSFIDPKNNKSIPQTAFLAIEQGKVVAANIALLIKSRKKSKARLISYKPDYDVWIAPVGGKYAVVHVGEWTISGFLGYFIKQIVDLNYFLSVLPLLKAVKLFFTDLKIFSKND